MMHSCSTRTLFYLKSTLNAVFFPDYEFTHAKATEFSKEPSLSWIQRNVDSYFSPIFGPQCVQFLHLASPRLVHGAWEGMEG